MSTAVIAGARPNFVKVAPLLRALRACDVEPYLVHTGQHYDRALSGQLFEDLGIPAPDVDLGVGSANHAHQTARVMAAFDDWLEAQPVDQVATVGDVNSTVACALVAVKRGIPVAHVEAGLRSFDRTMPEEVNRVVVDAVSTWLFTPSPDGDENLMAEGVHPSRIHRVGNIMVDSLVTSLPKARRTDVLTRLGLTSRYALVTLHRPALVDDASLLRGVLAALDEIASELPVVFPVHPRTRARLGERDVGRVRLCDPVGYLEFLWLQASAALVLTDSGGVQEETSMLGVPCLTLRHNTERPITITQGTNELVGLDRSHIVDAAWRALRRRRTPRHIDLWDGHAADRIAAVLAAGAPAVEWVPPALRREAEVAS